MRNYMEGINYIDIVVIVLTVFLGLKGIINGLVREALGLAGIVGGIYVASRSTEVVGEWINRNLYAFENQATLTLASFVLVLAVIWLSTLILAEILLRLVRLSALGGVDRILGFLFASGKVFVIFSIIAYALFNVEIIRVNLKRYTDTSIIYPVLLKVGGEIVKLKPIENFSDEATIATTEMK